jgi:hypothetical protein
LRYVNVHLSSVVRIIGDRHRMGCPLSCGLKQDIQIP